MGYVFKNQLIRLFYFCIPSAGRRSKMLKKKHFFYSMGENVHFQPRHLPADPKFIKLHNNICIASGVTFINHDILHAVLNNMDKDGKIKCQSHLGCIEVMDNVFIGSNSIILPNVRINENVIIGAGSIVTKDVPANSVVAGVPARVIGSFNDVAARRKAESMTITTTKRLERVGSEWKKFNKQR